MLRIFADRSHYDGAFRHFLADVLRPFWKGTATTDLERRTTYGPAVDEFRVVTSPREADVCVLPMAWNYYHQVGRVDRAVEYVERGRVLGLPVVSWVKNDYGVRVPVQDVHIFHQSSYRSRQRPHQQGTPVFIDDPLAGGAVPIRPKRPRPVVGFCGQATAPFVRTALRPFWATLGNLKSLARLSPDELQPLYPHTLLRARALRLLEQSPLVETNFIKRSHYRAGARAPADVERVRNEFFSNIQDSDYTVCIRGQGNFSARLYEVLAMGRIPIFIDTDCVLPAEDVVDWKSICVWVDRTELGRLPEIVADHHSRLSPAEFQDLQRACRRTWEETLSFGGFLKYFHDYFTRSMTAADDPHPSPIRSTPLHPQTHAR